jgi:hypothetical protein
MPLLLADVPTYLLILLYTSQAKTGSSAKQSLRRQLMYYIFVIIGLCEGSEYGHPVQQQLGHLVENQVLRQIQESSFIMFKDCQYVLWLKPISLMWLGGI